MSIRFALAAAALATAAVPVAASAVIRPAAPVRGESELVGQGTLFVLGVVAAIALAVVVLPEDQPASP